MSIIFQVPGQSGPHGIVRAKLQVDDDLDLGFYLGVEKGNWHQVAYLCKDHGLLVMNTLYADCSQDAEAVEELRTKAGLQFIEVPHGWKLKVKT